MLAHVRRCFPLLVAGALIAGCSEDGGSADTTAISTDTAVPTGSDAPADSTATAGTDAPADTAATETTATGNETTAPADTTAAAPADGFGSEHYSVTAALAQIPMSVLNEAEVPQISTGNVSAAASAVDVTPSADPDTLVDWLGPLTGLNAPGKVFVPYGGGFEISHVRADIGKWADMLGFTIADVEAFVGLDALPVQLTVAAGEFDESTLGENLVDVADGVVSDSELDDFATDLENVDDYVSPLGRATRLAYRDRLIAMGPGTDHVSTWLTGDGETAADDTELAALAEALDARDTYAAMLIKGLDTTLESQPRMTPEQAAQLKDRYADLLPNEAFGAVAIGWSLDDAGDPLVHLAYHFDSEDAAMSASERLESLYREGTSIMSDRPISDLLAFEQVSVEGSVAVVAATIPDTSRVQVPFDMLVQNEIVFMHN